MKTLKDSARAGVTLIELLVVILIVTILAVTMLPMFEKYVTKAQYAADAVPTIGHLKTQVDLYMYEHGKIPGLEGWAYGWTDKPDNSGYLPQMYEIKTKNEVEWKDPLDVTPPGAEDAGTTHVAKDLEVNTSEGFGKRLRPAHVFYACIRSGGYDKASNTTTGYAYALGAFGNGDGLKRNTGYAIMEIFFPKVLINNAGELGYKMLASWQNYAGLNPSVDASGDIGDKQVCFAKNSAETGVCTLPVEELAKDESSDKFDEFTTFKDVKDMYNTLRSTGACGEWEEIEFHDSIEAE